MKIHVKSVIFIAPTDESTKYVQKVKFQTSTDSRFLLLMCHFRGLNFVLCVIVLALFFVKEIAIFI